MEDKESSNPSSDHQSGGNTAGTSAGESNPVVDSTSTDQQVPTTTTTTTTTSNDHQKPTSSTSAFEKEREDYELSFNKMQQEIALVISTLVADDQMAKFRQEYEKMNRALVRSRENVEKYFAHHTVMDKEHRANLEAAQETAKIAANDQTNINSLKAQIAKIQENLEASSLREDHGKEQLRLLRMEISSLFMTLKQGVGLSVVQERTLQELQQTKEQITRELEQELDLIVQLRNRITDVSEHIKQSDEQKRTCESDIYELKEKSALKKSDIDLELRNKERLETELRELRVVVGNKTQEVRGKQDAVNRATEEISIIDYQIKTQRQMLERLEKDQESLTLRAVKLKQECGDQINGASSLREENEQLGREIKLKEMDLQKCRTEIKKINKIRDGLLKKNKALEELKSDHESKRREIRAKIESVEREEHKIKHQVDLHKKTIDDLNRERDVLKQNQGKALAETQRTVNLLAPYRQIKENLELEIMRAKNEIHEIEATTKRTHLEKDMYIKEAANLQAQLVECLTSIRFKEITIYDFKKQMVSADTKLKHQQALYEAVQSDRNLHAKHLIESQAEISEMKRKLRIMNYQINGYKDDIRIKQEYLVKEGSEHSRLKKDADMINDEIKTLKNQNDLAQAYIRTQLAEEFRLNQFVKEAELERTRQETSLQTLINERDNLSDQLIKQNVELTKVYDKIKSQHTSLHTSEKLYNTRLSEITSLYERIGEARRVISEYKKETDTIEELKFKQCRISNEVVFEKTRVKALEEQLEYPVNIHRWRKLEGSNPKAFEMIQLVHTLQKKISKKIDADKALGEKMALHQETYLQCKALLSKQVGPEALEQLSEYEKIHKEKAGQVRHLEAELNMYQAQSKEYKHTISVLDAEITDLKKRYVQEWFKQHQNYNTSGFSSVQKHTPKSITSGRGHLHAASISSEDKQGLIDSQQYEGEESDLQESDGQEYDHLQEQETPIESSNVSSLVKGVENTLPPLPRLAGNEADIVQQTLPQQTQQEQQQLQEEQTSTTLPSQQEFLHEAAQKVLPESTESLKPKTAENAETAPTSSDTEEQTSALLGSANEFIQPPSSTETTTTHADNSEMTAGNQDSGSGVVQEAVAGATEGGLEESKSESNTADDAEAQILSNTVISEALSTSQITGTSASATLSSHEAGLEENGEDGGDGAAAAIVTAATDSGSGEVMSFSTSENQKEEPKSFSSKGGGALFDSKPGSAESGNEINAFDE